MKTTKTPLTNNQLIDIFNKNEWDADIIDGKVIAMTYDKNLEACDIDVTGWTAAAIEDYFGFDEPYNNERSYFANSLIHGYCN